MGVRYNHPPVIGKRNRKKKDSMPIYTYRCSNCGIQFDQQQSFSDQPLVRCPECGKKSLKKVYQPVGIVFKGSGFYATDHHSPSGQLSKKEDKGDQGSSAKKDSDGSTSAKSNSDGKGSSEKSSSESKE